MMDPASLIHAARQDFIAFAQKAFQIINPGTSFLDNWHIAAIAYVLEEMSAGKHRRQIINMPPRTLKSQLVSVIWPAFLLGHNPGAKIIVVSYAAPLAEQLSNDTRRLMESRFYQEAFPQTRLDRQTNLHLTTEKSGSRFATTVGGSLTGFGADWIIIDDPHNATEAYSETSREKVKSFFRQTLLSRLNNPSQGRIVLVMQRLHEDDLSGHLLRGGGWRHLRLQARATEDAEIATGKGLFHQVRVGDYLQPDLLAPDWLEAHKREMLSAEYEAQYQQQPLPAEGNMIKKEWLRYADAQPSRDAGKVALSLDTATKEGTENDYSACTVWVEAEGKHHLIHVWRDRVDFPTLYRKVQELVGIFRPNAVLIEDAGTGSALVHVLHEDGVPAVPRKAKDPKTVRLSSVSTYLEAGLMWLPKDAPWLGEFEAELLGFPGARHDDQVDSLSQYFGWVRERPTSIFECDWMRDEDWVDHERIAARLVRGS
jgi:predicted phage terminase large subunit-like protein